MTAPALLDEARVAAAAEEMRARLAELDRLAAARADRRADAQARFDTRGLPRDLWRIETRAGA